MPGRTLLFALVAALAAAAIQNPVLSGDHPDPSVIRVRNEYWAANTSSEWAPVFPLFSSTDLQHWQQRSSVFTNPPDWASANFWAPELTMDRGHIRLYYAARKRNGPLCVAVATADLPAGPYTDHGPMVCQEDGSIDPFFTRDEKGKPYLIWKEDGNSRNLPSIIYAQQTSEDGLTLTGSPHQLIRSDVPWEGKVVEGPDVVRHDGYFYLLYAGGACCGRQCNYGVGVARAKSLLGPWEKDSANPIVASNADWQCPGHGTAVQGPNGSEYFLYHAYSRAGFVFTGRETLLDRIAWKNGWPAIDNGQGPSARMKQPPPSVSDDFRASALQPGWQWPLHDRPETRLSAGGLELTSPPARAGDFLGAILAHSLASVDYTAETSLLPESLDAGRAAGLAIVGDRRNAAGIAVRGGRIIQWQIDRGQWKELSSSAAPDASPVRLRIQGRGATRFRTWYAGNDGPWIEIGKLVDVTALPPWDRGLRVALFGNGGKPARFGAFNLQYGTSD